MSDPFIFADEKTKTYYLTGSGGRFYKSPDLKTWSPITITADLTGTWMAGNFVASPRNPQNQRQVLTTPEPTPTTPTSSNKSPAATTSPRNQTQVFVSGQPSKAPTNPSSTKKISASAPDDWDIIDGTLSSSKTA